MFIFNTSVWRRGVVMAVLCLLSAAIISCGGGGKEESNHSSGAAHPSADSVHNLSQPQEAKYKQAVYSVPEARQQALLVSGTVRTRGGKPLAGVRVSAGRLSTTTDKRGMFRLNKVDAVAHRAVLTFGKEGYFSITRSIESSNKAELFDVVMHPKTTDAIALQTSFNSSQQTVLAVGSGAQVTIAADALVDTLGNPYHGQVQAEVLYLDPTADHFEAMMPGGDLAAVRTDNDTVQLISYGMLNVQLHDANGNKLQLQEGKPGAISYPVPKGMEADAPPSIPLWYFNEQTGLWQEEGIAYLQNGHYTGMASHFSWWNLDVPESRAKLQGTLTDCNNEPLAGIKVSIGQLTRFTNAEGQFSSFVPANTPFEVAVKALDYFGHSGDILYKVDNMQARSERTLNMQLPCMPKIRGEVSNECGKFNWAYIHCDYTTKSGHTFTTHPRHVYPGQHFAIPIATEATKATLHARLSDGTLIKREVSCQGKDVKVRNIDVCRKDSAEMKELIFTGIDELLLMRGESDKMVISVPKDKNRVRYYNKNSFGIHNTNRANISTCEEFYAEIDMKIDSTFIPVAGTLYKNVRLKISKEIGPTAIIETICPRTRQILDVMVNLEVKEVTDSSVVMSVNGGGRMIISTFKSSENATLGDDTKHPMLILGSITIPKEKTYGHLVNFKEKDITTWDDLKIDGLTGKFPIAVKSAEYKHFSDEGRFVYLWTDEINLSEGRKREKLYAEIETLTHSLEPYNPANPVGERVLPKAASVRKLMKNTGFELTERNKTNYTNVLTYPTIDEYRHSGIDGNLYVVTQADGKMLIVIKQQSF
jgi:hypothetical protein